jgi:hypothetical protein
VENRTASDGSDLGEKLARLFEVLNTPPDKRQKNLDETLAAFPYVNGELFNEHLGFADFNRDMRIRNIPGIKKRVDAVRDFRLASKKEPTRKMADRPSVFAEIRQPKKRFMVVPQHTSETRKYVPFGYFDPKNIVHNSCSAIPNATFFHLAE